MSELLIQGTFSFSTVGAASEIMSDMPGDTAAAALSSLARSMHVHEFCVSMYTVRDGLNGCGYKLSTDMDLENEV